MSFEDELATTEQSLSEVQRQLEATSELQAELKHLQLAEESVVTAQVYADAAKEVDAELENFTDWIEAQAGNLPEVSESSASIDLLRGIRARLMAGLVASKSSLEQLRQSFNR